MTDIDHIDPGTMPESFDVYIHTQRSPAQPPVVSMDGNAGNIEITFYQGLLEIRHYEGSYDWISPPEPKDSLGHPGHSDWCVKDSKL